MTTTTRTEVTKSTPYSDEDVANALARVWGCEAKDIKWEYSQGHLAGATVVSKTVTHS